MHGLVLTSFRQYTWTRLPDHAWTIWSDLPTYEPDRAYDDGELHALLDRTAEVTGRDRGDVLRDFGRFTGFWVFRVMRPDYYEESAGTRRFLLDVEARIHETVRATTPGAAPPYLHVTPLGDDGVSIAYTSPRRLCDLVVGLVSGVADYYGERFAIDEPMCMQRGDPACSFVVMPG